MSEVRKECFYTETHEWVLVKDDVATIGIDDFAQSQSGELVFVELPEIGAEFSKGDDACVVESVKSASDVYTPLTGVVLDVNKELEDNPVLVNESCYDKGWLFKIKLSDLKEIDSLMSAEEYEKNILA